jgi:hypothetical protein
MRKYLIILILLTFTIPASAATIYKWVDKEGTVNFTDDYNQIPSAYRHQIKIEMIEESSKVGSPPAAQTPPQKSEEATTATYGLGESYWRDKVRPWKDQLGEATENYEKAQRNFTRKSEEMSKTNFYGRSRSQTKWDVMELKRLDEEVKKYEAQMSEANSMLEKISKEAQEWKANPDWLK